MVNEDLTPQRLAEVLQDFLYENRYDHDLFNDLQKNLKKHEIFSKDITDIMNKRTDFKDIPATELVLFARIVYGRFPDFEIINPQRYFKPGEIKAAQYYTRNNRPEYIKLPLTVNNALSVQYDEYIAIMSAKQLVKMLDSSIVTYNFDSQRDAKSMVDTNGRIVRAINVNQKSVIEIAQLMLNGEYLPDMLTFNMLLGSNDEREEFSSKGNSIVVNEGTQLDILDGFHRLSAMQQAVEANPEFDLNFPVAFKNFDIQKAKRYVGQTNTFNVMPKAYVEQLRAKDHYAYIVNELINNSDLKGRVGYQRRPIFDNGEITTFDRLKNAIQKQYNVKMKREAMGVVETLVPLFDELIFLYLSEKPDPHETLFATVDGIDRLLNKYKKIDKDIKRVDLDFLLATTEKGQLL
ncbi:hypothetical protein EVJ32_04710 [Exiguobacterium sp. SH5S4]|uniref:DNA sulfur modification protein DndB n=1 Tax=Exiguobacterium sp. SH5S4 TaxID=2510961 RepID=UPI00103E27CF|nr:DNA sulfur modification protein DndB [Exiguobacterium sp. SH5S4]TCI26679.1 hypothetical protein EVJ32_04710 [Exiguobacterium sp. SH5S4]